jgi:DNA-binding IclR family transcriptional regulator
MGESECKAPAVRQAVQIIELLCASDEPMSLAQVSRALKLNKNTAVRILKTLAESGWVRVMSPGPYYAMTLKPFSITSQPLQRMSLREAAFGHLHALWQEINETIYLAIRDDDKVLHVMYFESTRDVRVCGRVGVKYPIPGGVAATIFLAYAEEEDFVRMAGGSGTALTKLRRQGAVLRKRQWDRENTQAADIRALGVPIFEHSGTCIAVVAIMSLKSQCSIAKLNRDYRPKLIQAGQAISQELGYAGRT